MIKQNRIKLKYGISQKEKREAQAARQTARQGDKDRHRQRERHNITLSAERQILVE